MFIAEPNKNDLRQGDILQGIYYPLMKCGSIELIGIPEEKPSSSNDNIELIAISKKAHNVNWLSAQIQVFCGFSIILSQCCDLARRNGKFENNSFVVSPLVDIPHGILINEEKLSQFQQNPLDDFVNLYHIPQVSPLSKAYMVDFGRVVSLPRSEFDFALSGKVLQMTDEARVQFKVKLSRHFGRPTQEEIEANLYSKL